jgi:hypothetical protein
MLLCSCSSSLLSLLFNVTTGDIAVQLNNEELFINSDVFIYRQGRRLSQAEGTLKMSSVRQSSGYINRTPA